GARAPSLRADGVVGDEDHPSLLDRRRHLLVDRLHAVPAVRQVRPALPPGPYLVVGLARSGAAAMRMLAPHGEVIGVDSGSQREVPQDLETHLGSDGLDLLDRAGTLVKSPGVPQEAPVVQAARARGIEVTGELELAWRL